MKMANFVHAIGDGVTHAGDEIASDDGKIGAEIVGHVHGATHVRAGHVAVAGEVNVADLNDLHAVEGGRQVWYGDFDAADLVVQALCGIAVHGSDKRGSAGGGSGGAEKVAASGIRNHFR